MIEPTGDDRTLIYNITFSQSGGLTPGGIFSSGNIVWTPESDVILERFVCSAIHTTPAGVAQRVPTNIRIQSLFTTNVLSVQPANFPFPPGVNYQFDPYLLTIPFGVSDLERDFRGAEIVIRPDPFLVIDVDCYGTFAGVDSIGLSVILFYRYAFRKRNP